MPSHVGRTKGLDDLFKKIGHSSTRERILAAVLSHQTQILVQVLHICILHCPHIGPANPACSSNGFRMLPARNSSWTRNEQSSSCVKKSPTSPFPRTPNTSLTSACFVVPNILTLPTSAAVTHPSVGPVSQLLLSAQQPTHHQRPLHALLQHVTSSVPRCANSTQQCLVQPAASGVSRVFLLALPPGRASTPPAHP
jgi:hypothetical protein